MMDENEIRRQIHRAVEQRAGRLSPDPGLAQRIIAQTQGKEEIKMKKKFSVAFALVLILALLAATALAVTQLDELRAVWEDSFARMHTTGSFEAVDQEEFDLGAFEAQYKENTGLDRKEDLVISTVPDENGLPYDQAYRIARQAILDAFGTPEAELDAMGIYPVFCQGVYEEDISEWEFYFTPRTNVDIDLDHDYEAPGEYRVFVESPSGEVSGCFWYLDVFFPEYADRTWNAGKYEYVFERACSFDGRGFWQMSIEEQTRYRQLFAEKGFDLSRLKKE